MARHNMILGNHELHESIKFYYITLNYFLFYFLSFILLSFFAFSFWLFFFWLRLPVDPGTWSLLRIHRERPRRTRRLRHRVTTTRGGRGGAHFVHPACTKLCARVRKFANFANLGGGGGTPPVGPKTRFLGVEADLAEIDRGRG